MREIQGQPLIQRSIKHPCSNVREFETFYVFTSNLNPIKIISKKLSTSMYI